MQHTSCQKHVHISMSYILYLGLCVCVCLQSPWRPEAGPLLCIQDQSIHALLITMGTNTHTQRHTHTDKKINAELQMQSTTHCFSPPSLSRFQITPPSLDCDWSVLAFFLDIATHAVSQHTKFEHPMPNVLIVLSVRNRYRHAGMCLG